MTEGMRESDRKMDELVRSKVGDFGGGNMIMTSTPSMRGSKMEKELVVSGREPRVEMGKEKKKEKEEDLKEPKT